MPEKGQRRQYSPSTHSAAVLHGDERVAVVFNSGFIQEGARNIKCQCSRLSKIILNM